MAWVASGSERWARREGAGPEELAAASDAALDELVAGALDLGVRWLTVCTGAADPASGPLASWPERAADRLHPLDVAVRVLGPGGALAAPGHPPAGDGPALVCTVAGGHSGRAEIVHAIERLAAEGVDPAKVDEAAIAGRLYAPDMPDPDLVVRTGGDRRIPDVLLWEIAYSELVFVAAPWPDTDRAGLFDAVAEFQRRDRRYGGLVAPAARP